MKNILRNIVAAMLACSASAVLASSYSFSYMSSAVGVDSFPLHEVDGTLTVADTQNSLGSYDILGISGVVWGDGGGLITGLINNPNQPNATSNFGFIYDNVFTLNSNGVLFTVGDGSTWNLFKTGFGYRLYSYDSEGPAGLVDSFGTFSATLMNVSPVPEPETYAMMIAGLGLLGAVARRRKQKAVA